MQGWKSAPYVQEDPILGLTKVYIQDPRPGKMSLLAGILRREGQIWLFDSVRQAQSKALAQQTNKGYLPIEGHSSFVQELEKQVGIPQGYCYGMQSIGGTGALHLSAGLLHAMGLEGIYISDPTWPNHRRIFEQAGIKVMTYRYPFNDPSAENQLITELQEGSSRGIILHGCCHNPTGIDLTSETFSKILEVILKQNHCLIIDLAYHGLKKNLHEDANLVHMAIEKGVNLLLCYSCAKNFTLYGERAGVLWMHWNENNLQKSAQNYLSHLARATYSTPPLNGALIVQYLLQDVHLTTLWKKELEEARSHIQLKREKLVLAFREIGLEHIANGISWQSGLFAYFPLSHQAVEALRENRAIYLPKEGRINVTSLEENQLPILMQALQEVWEKT